MKIAQIVCTFPPYEGGIGNSAFNFAHFFSNDNLEFTTFTPKYKKIKEPDKNNKVIRNIRN
jgi:glycogen synthase